jgi:hypothetical protein
MEGSLISARLSLEVLSGSENEIMPIDHDLAIK